MISEARRIGRATEKKWDSGPSRILTFVPPHFYLYFPPSPMRFWGFIIYIDGRWGSIDGGWGSVVDVVVSGTTVRTRINNPCARTLELPLLVRSGVFSSSFFSFLFVSESTFFGMFVDPFPEEDISDYPAHGPIIRVLTVLGYGRG